MRKVFFILTTIFIFFLIEFILFNFIGKWFLPNLMLLAIVFFNLLWGIRYGIFTAILAGLVRDSFSANPFGVHLFSFVVCAYMSAFFKKTIYHVGSRSARLLLIALICLINFVVQFFLHMAFGVVTPSENIYFILIPEFLTTLLVASFVFNRLKICVLKFYGSL